MNVVLVHRGVRHAAPGWDWVLLRTTVPSVQTDRVVHRLRGTWVDEVYALHAVVVVSVAARTADAAEAGERLA